MTEAKVYEVNWCTNCDYVSSACGCPMFTNDIKEKIILKSDHDRIVKEKDKEILEEKRAMIQRIIEKTMRAKTRTLGKGIRFSVYIPRNYVLKLLRKEAKDDD